MPSKQSSKKKVQDVAPPKKQGNPFTKQSPNTKTATVVASLGLSNETGIVAARNFILRVVKENPAGKCSEIVKKVQNDRKIVGLKVERTKDEELWHLGKRIDVQCGKVISKVVDLTNVPISRLLGEIAVDFSGKYEHSGEIIYEASAMSVALFYGRFRAS
ncbi:unnamed protein product [Amoebophrya sp. A25]|nr:unnamed protein product [Amoebophrya sp. A25]|eukprot:GSA25T00007817001.1